jgi:hypothetical protein
MDTAVFSEHDPKHRSKIKKKFSVITKVTKQTSTLFKRFRTGMYPLNSVHFPFFYSFYGSEQDPQGKASHRVQIFRFS